MKGIREFFRDSQICDLDFYSRAFIVRYQDEVLLIYPPHFIKKIDPGIRRYMLVQGWIGHLP